MRPSDHIDAPPLVLRPYRDDDVQALSRAIAQSIEHLRPWMGWAALEPLPIAERAALVRSFMHKREEGEDFIYGMFLDGAVVGGCGLHRRLGPDALEIGYWVHVACVGRGFATIAAAGLVDAAFALPEIERVEIHHDKANAASRRVPEKLGFTLVGEAPDAKQGLSDIGIECRWRVTRAEWARSVRPAGARAPRAGGA
jgi:RimJ/RimL family protein N-acetyltransferase